MTVINCESIDIPVNPPRMDEEPWQVRLKRAGLSQKTLAKLLGVAENTVSLQLRGRWKTGIPRYVKAFIVAWERMSHTDREYMLDTAEDDYQPKS